MNELINDSSIQNTSYRATKLMGYQFADTQIVFHVIIWYDGSNIMTAIVIRSTRIVIK